jgi:hypothetical protein
LRQTESSHAADLHSAHAGKLLHGPRASARKPIDATSG